MRSFFDTVLDVIIMLIQVGSYALYILFMFILFLSIVMRRWFDGAWRVFALFKGRRNVAITEGDVSLGSCFGSDYFNLKCERLSAKLFIRYSILGGIDLRLGEIVTLLLGIIIPIYPIRFIDISPVVFGESKVNSAPVDADINYIIYSFKRHSYDLSWNVRDGIDRLYGDLAKKLSLWKLVASMRMLKRAGVLASSFRVWMLKKAFLVGAFDSIRVGKFIYFLYLIVSLTIPLSLLMYVIQGCENQCSIIQYFVFTPVVGGGFLGSISFYMLSTKISVYTVFLVSYLSRICDFLITILFAMSLYFFRESGDSYFDQNSIFLLYLIAFVLLQRLNIHRMYEIAQSRLKL